MFCEFLAIGHLLQICGFFSYFKIELPWKRDKMILMYRAILKQTILIEPALNFASTN